MTKPYYELHVTMVGQPHKLSKLVTDMRWTFSQINGDPDLGPGLKCYATKQLNSDKFTQEEAEAAVRGAGSALRSQGAVVIREKVELVLYDLRSPE